MTIHAIIVEDDPMVAQINQQYLRQMGQFEVDGLFTNGLEALEYLREYPVDLVILDIYMPVISGNELLRKLAAENIKCAVIMVTAATEVQAVDEALRLGVVDYLIKPFSFQRFQEAIRKYLSQRNLLKNTTLVNQAVVDQLLHSDSPTTSMDQ